MIFTDKISEPVGITQNNRNPVGRQEIKPPNSTPKKTLCLLHDFKG